MFYVSWGLLCRDASQDTPGGWQRLKGKISGRKLRMLRKGESKGRIKIYSVVRVARRYAKSTF